MLYHDYSDNKSDDNDQGKSSSGDEQKENNSEIDESNEKSILSQIYFYSVTYKDAYYFLDLI